MKILMIALLALGFSEMSEAKHHKKREKGTPANEARRSKMIKISEQCRNEVLGGEKRKFNPEERKKMSACIKKHSENQSKGMKASRGELPLVNGERQERPPRLLKEENVE